MRIFLFLCLCLLQSQAEMLTRSKLAMGTLVSLSVPVENKELLQKGFLLLEDLEKALSSYPPNGAIYHLNRKKTLTPLDPFTYEALVLSKKYYLQTQGYFDITIGSITKDLYHFGEQEKVVDKQTLQKANIAFFALHFERDKAFLEENISVDLGGMGKGFSVDKIATLFTTEKLSRGIISLSGDIRCIGICTLGIDDPFKEGIMARFTTKQEITGVSTSGTYRRFVKTKEHHHLIDPKAKQQQQEFLSITLIATLPNSDLDAYATAASVMPKEMAYRFLDEKNIAYIIMQSDHRIVLSANLKEFVKSLEFIEQEGK